MSTVRTCPICSAPTEKTRLYLSGGAETPEEERCSNVTCPAHLNPQAMEEHHKHIASIYAKQGLTARGLPPEESEKKNPKKTALRR